MPTTDSESVVVGVKSAWTSKVNWTGAAAVIFGLLGFLGMEVSTENQAEVTNAAMVIIGFLVMVFRTFFTKSVTKASAAGVRDPGGNDGN